MGSFTLTNATMLGGLAMLAVPMLVHLMRRRVQLTVVFPTLAFLQAAQTGQSRFHSLKRWLLLLLRLFALAGIVLAFTRPVWWKSALSAANSGQPEAVVVVLDRSLSTGQSSGAGRLSDRLLQEARVQLEGLTAGRDSASVVIADEAPRTLLPRLTGNLPALIDDLQQVPVSQGRADLWRAISMAVRLLENDSGPRRLVILTDRQKSNWNEPGQDWSVPESIAVVIPELEWAVEANASLHDLRLSPSVPVTGEPVELTVQSQQSGSVKSTARPSAEWVGDVTTGSKDRPLITASRGQDNALSKQGPLRFDSQFPGDPFPAARVRLSTTDALPEDNVVWQVATRQVGTPVLIVSDEPVDQPGTAAFYLSRALAPYGTDPTTVGRFAVRTITSKQLTETELAGNRICFLTEIGLLEESAARALVQSVESGCSLFVWSGSGPVDENIRRLEAGQNTGLFPWTLSKRVTGTGKSAWTISGGAWKSHWLRDFDELAQVALSRITFSQAWQAGPVREQTETLLRFSEGSPALGVRPFGKGQVVLANFSPEDRFTSLGKHGTFVALVQMLGRRLLSDESATTALHVGDPLVWTLAKPAAGELNVVQPDGTSRPVSAPVDPLRIETGRASQAGVYRLKSGNEKIGAVAVNVDPRESDLERLGSAELVAMLSGGGGLQSDAGSKESGGHTAASMPGGEPLWGACLLLSAACLAVEMLLLGVWRR